MFFVITTFEHIMGFLRNYGVLFHVRTRLFRVIMPLEHVITRVFFLFFAQLCVVVFSRYNAHWTTNNVFFVVFCSA